MKKSYGWFPFLDKIGRVVFFLRGFFGRKQTANVSGTVKMAPEEIAAWTEPRKLKYWYDKMVGHGVKLNGGSGRILIVWKKEDGFKFEENNNSHFSETYTKEQALEVLDELKWWIENN